MLRSFTKSVLTLLMVAGLTTISIAQDTDDMARPITKSGSAAWIFSINGLGDFGIGGNDVETGDDNDPVLAAGFRAFISDGLAIRALVGFQTESSGEKSATTASESSTELGIAAGVEVHTGPLYSISPYFGGQVSFGMGGHTTESESNTVEESHSQFGIAALAGFDWYFTKGIFLGAEYTLGFASKSSSSTSGGTTTDAPSSSTIGIGSGNVHLGVHF
jgi:opacity protein-like surface antigen